VRDLSNTQSIVNTPYVNPQFQIDNNQNRVQRWYFDNSEELILINYISLNYLERLCHP
jgi:hypothetical protein